MLSSSPWRSVLHCSSFVLSSLFELLWEKALHIHLSFLNKIVHERYKKKVYEDGAMLDQRRAATNANVILLVFWVA
jgi:hypothetical protein